MCYMASGDEWYEKNKVRYKDREGILDNLVWEGLLGDIWAETRGTGVYEPSRYFGTEWIFIIFSRNFAVKGSWEMGW